MLIRIACASLLILWVAQEALAGLSTMPRRKTYVSGEVLQASDLNADADQNVTQFRAIAAYFPGDTLKVKIVSADTLVANNIGKTVIKDSLELISSDTVIIRFSEDGLRFIDSTLVLNSNEWGAWQSILYAYGMKTDGDSDSTDVFRSTFAGAELNQSDGLVGYVMGDYAVAKLSDGRVKYDLTGNYAVAQVVNDTVNRDVVGVRVQSLISSGGVADSDLFGENIEAQNAGVTGAKLYGTKVDASNTGTVTSDLYGMHLSTANTGTVSGSTYGLYLQPDDADWAIYQESGYEAPSRLRGSLAIGPTDVAGTDFALVFSEGTSPTSAPANTAILFASLYGGNTELFVQDELGNESILSSNVEVYPEDMVASKVYPYVTFRKQKKERILTFISLNRMAELIQDLSHREELLHPDSLIIKHITLPPDARWEGVPQ